MIHKKVWLMVAPLDYSDATWINEFFEWAVETHDPVTFDTAAGSVSVPIRKNEVFVTTRGDQQETMFTLKFSDKCVLYSHTVEIDDV